MSRVRTADQCRAMKPQHPMDKKIYHCGRRLGHAGQHSAGKHAKWDGAYPAEKKA